ncbi:hypothetical protein GCM10020219_100410 [Nonomuraea dietziae]
MDVEGLLLLLLALDRHPLEVAVSGQQTPARGEGPLKAGFSATVSSLALIMREPMEGSFAQTGTSPHRMTLSCLTARSASFGTLLSTA